MSVQRGLLFDTQAIISWAQGTVPQTVISAVLDGRRVHASRVSFWEFLLKSRFHSVGISFENFQEVVLALDADVLGIELAHLNTLRTLPFLKKPQSHADPFDRMIIAQAITEKLVLVGSDTRFPDYVKLLGKSLKVMWK